jgi:multiple sugar transport system permease protein
MAAIAKQKTRGKKNRRENEGYAFILPGIIYMILVVGYPIVYNFILSFKDTNVQNLAKGTSVFIGLQNYKELFSNPTFLLILKNTFIFAAVTGPASYLISYIVAWFINELPPKVRAIVTLIFYAPSIAGNVYLIWGTLFSGDAYGWVNGFLLDMGVIDTPILWFQNADYVMPLIIMVALWTSLGTSFLSFIAGLQGINKSLYEAGAIDGVKNRWQELWYITLPSMKPQLMFGAILSITGSFGFGGIVTALAGNPSVDYVAYTLTHHLEEYQGNRWEVGYASAISFILFLIMIGCNVLISKLISKLGE